MLAQRFPDAYDGIAAGAPAVYWGELFAASLWAQTLMIDRDDFPPGCEFEYIKTAAIKACDPLDGVVDGLVANEDECDFDPMSLVGQQFNCSTFGAMHTLGETSAIVAASAWAGPRGPDGEFLWYGPNVDARLAGDAAGGILTADQGYAQTLCQNGQNGTCRGAPAGFGDKWLPIFVQKNSTAKWEDITLEELPRLLKQGVQQFDSIVGTSDPDLAAFRAKGGKMITYHGMVSALQNHLKRG